MERCHWSLLVLVVLAAIPAIAQEKSVKNHVQGSKELVSEETWSNQSSPSQTDFINETYEDMLAAQLNQGIFDPIRLAAAVQHPSREVPLEGKENRQLNHPPSRLTVNRQPPTRTKRLSTSQRLAAEPHVLNSLAGASVSSSHRQQVKEAESASMDPVQWADLEIRKELEAAYDALLVSPESKSWKAMNLSLIEQQTVELGASGDAHPQDLEARQTAVIMSVAGKVEQLACEHESGDVGAESISADMEITKEPSGVSIAAFVVDEERDVPPVPALPVFAARELKPKNISITPQVDQPGEQSGRIEGVVPPPELGVEKRSLFTAPSPDDKILGEQEGEVEPKESPVTLAAEETIPFVPPIVDSLGDVLECDQPVCDQSVADSMGVGTDSLFSFARDRRKGRGFELRFDIGLGNRGGHSKQRASDCGWYGLRCPEVYYSVFGGATSVSNMVDTILLGDSGGDGNVVIQPVIETEVEYAFEDAFAVGFAVGQIHGRHLRTELEMSFRNNNAESLSVSQSGERDLYDLDGELRSFSGMGNAYWEFVDFPMLRIKPYVGAGVGFALIDSELAWDGFRLLDDSYEKDSAFAYQAMAGVNVCTGPKMSLFVEYRYFGTDSIRYKVGSLSNEFKVATDNVFVGLRFKF
ncbi:MAG: outer membrane beta-barrel protein [Mariniblastus sp.]|nr:outer membrane beta-barrel protein [Mariniblastus sp.]